jgi:hypothetical protein
MTAAEELVRHKRIGEETWEALAERYSAVQLMDVVSLVGCYTLMAMVTLSFDIEIEGDPGTESRLAGLRQYT